MSAAARMVRATTSDAGKSLLCAALCRWLWRSGVDVPPFEPQNMALGSAVTADGGEPELGLLEMETRLEPKKRLRNVRGILLPDGMEALRRRAELEDPSLLDHSGLREASPEPLGDAVEEHPDTALLLHLLEDQRERTHS